MRTLAKPDLGIKRVCPSCGARFYDLQKRPIECPKCAFAFEPEALVKQRRPRVVEAPPAPAPAPAAEAEAEPETEEAEESVEAMAEAEHAEAEEEEAAEAEAAEEPVVVPVAPAAEPAEAFEEEEAEEEEEQDDSLLEEVEEEEDDVSGIIDTDIGKEEP